MEKNIVKYQEDFSPEESSALQGFVAAGCPGLAKIDEDKTFEWFRLYMSGKGYSEIASICKVKKELVLFIANRLKWHEQKMEYYTDISKTMMHKHSIVKAEGVNTIATMVSALNHYFGERFTQYLRTRDSRHIEGIDSKMLAQYYKSIEILEKLMTDGMISPKESSQPSVNINVQGSATVEQNPDGSVSVTSDAAAKDILAALAKYKKTIAEEDG